MSKDKERKLPAHAIPSTKLPLLTDLPPDVYDGIGQVVSAHAVLENRVLFLLFKLMETDASIGRVSLGYRAASERFKTVKRLIDLHGITVAARLNDLENQIKDCCDARDQFAHGVWVSGPQGRPAIQVTRGIYETPDGKADRNFVPEVQILPDDYFSQTRNIILNTAYVVNLLIDEVAARLQAVRDGRTD